ncbi:MAG: arsenate reductase (glutaredoxin) [Bacteroidetes bacterium HGW-Bacteroidetes-17]|jgi:arsenate reductase (glutaredoxin)|nr:MAG: arsenate reductase (glutaredoxin) [Bacteroidetes bacterium HGW-Bacteroidetes-17]
MYTIYHNPRCSKSRAGLAYLESEEVKFQVVDYIKNPLSPKELKELLMKMNLKPIEIIRTQEDSYKSDLKGKNFTDDEWIRILIENPKLMQRPIVAKKHKAVLAQPPEKIAEL